MLKCKCGQEFRDDLQHKNQYANSLLAEHCLTLMPPLPSIPATRDGYAAYNAAIREYRAWQAEHGLESFEPVLLPYLKTA